MKDPFDPGQNVEAGTRLLKQLLTKYNNDVIWPWQPITPVRGASIKTAEFRKFQETQNYVNQIQSNLSKNRPNPSSSLRAPERSPLNFWLFWTI